MQHRGAGVKASIQDQELGPCLVRALARKWEMLQKPPNQRAEPLCYGAAKSELWGARPPKQQGAPGMPATSQDHQQFQVRRWFPEGLLTALNLGPKEAYATEQRLITNAGTRCLEHSLLRSLITSLQH